MFWKTKYTSSVLRHTLWVIASLTFPILSDKSHKKWNIRKYMEKYSVHIRGNMHCIFGDMFITYLGAALSDQGWGGHWGPDFLWDAWSGWAIQGQTVGTKRHLHFAIQTNIFCHLDKYILPFGQIYFDQGWVQIPFGISLVELSNTRTDSWGQRDTYILPFRQIYFAIWTNTFCHLDKYILIKAGSRFPLGFPWSSWAIQGQTVGTKETREWKDSRQPAQRHWYRDDKDED